MELLSSILSEDPSKLSEEQQILWFARLLKWLQRPRSKDEKEERWETIYSTRLKFLLMQIHKSEEWQSNFITLFNLVMIHLSKPFQMVLTGMPSETSFLQDFVKRLQEKILPNTPLENDLGTLIREIFNDPHESLLIDAINEDILSELMILLAKDAGVGITIRTHMLEALRIISIQMLEGALSIRIRLGVSDTNRFTFPEFELEESVFHNLIQDSAQALDEIWVQLDNIQAMTDVLFEQMKKGGVKTDIVYSFQVHRKRQKRFRLILNILDPKKSIAASTRLLASQLVTDVYSQSGLFSFLRSNLSLLSKQVVESNSHIGEHYIAKTWQDFNEMFASAAGGGIITSLTVFIKYGIAKLSFTGFLKGFADGVNYSTSFSIIQLLGFTLATKQPSTTAPFINRQIKESTAQAGQTMLAVLRTQFIAVFGNLVTVFPVCFLVSWFALWWSHPLFTYAEAHHMFDDHKFLGPSPIFAAFTGVLLFSSSIFAGWFENFCVITELPKRIEFNKRINRLIGVNRSKKFANFIEHNGNVVAANISLGFILGLVPPTLAFLNIPLEARHVTLSTGAVAASLPIVLSHGVSASEIINVVIGLLTIGLMNISISFLLALGLASVSSGTSSRALFSLFKWGVMQVLWKPWLLLLPEDKNTK